MICKEASFSTHGVSHPLCSVPSTWTGEPATFRYLLTPDTGFYQPENLLSALASSGNTAHCGSFAVFKSLCLRALSRNFISSPDLNGIDLTPVQDTPVASRKEDTYVHFNVDIELQKHVEKLTKGAAIFFEFKHYKPKKRFTSTKCFCFHGDGWN